MFLLFLLMVCDDCKPLAERLETAEKSIKELERRLLAYENAHTPPSRRYKPRLPPSEDAKRGAPEGHKGATREDPDPTLRVELVKETCEHCKARLPKPFWVERKLVEEIPEPQPVEVTEYLISHYLCSSCGEHVSADGPNLGRFGPRTCAHVALLKFSDRLPHAKVAQALARQFNLEVTPPTVLSITNRVSDAVQHKYDALRKQLLKEKYIHIDETSLRVAGRTYWVWVFCTNMLTFYVIQPTRGGRVVEELLHDYKGVVVTDGYKVYQKMGSAQQRCWAHLLREAEWLASEHDMAKPIFDQLRTMYHEVKALCKRAKINRQRAYDSFMLRMNQLADLCSAHREMRKFAITLRNGINAWFTAILHKGVALTNNLAERQLREIVVQRKIFGTLRTERGTTTLQTLMSILMTWHQKGKNALAELTRTLTLA